MSLKTKSFLLGKAITKSLLCLLFNLAFINSLFAFGEDQVVTKFRWLPQNTDKEFKGTCYEVDLETGGDQYLKRTLRENCALDKSQLGAVWVASEGKPGGRCFLVDTQTSGQLFSMGANWKECAPPKEQTTYQVFENKCYLMGPTPNGQMIKKVDDEFCLSKQVSYEFVLSPS